MTQQVMVRTLVMPHPLLKALEFHLIALRNSTADPLTPEANEALQVCIRQAGTHTVKVAK